MTTEAPPRDVIIRCNGKRRDGITRCNHIVARVPSHEWPVLLPSQATYECSSCRKVATLAGFL